MIRNKIHTDSKLNYRLNKVRNVVKFNTIKPKKEILTETEEKIEEIDNSLYEELMEGLKNIKNKRSLARFIKSSKEEINSLTTENKNNILKYIKETFY